MTDHDILDEQRDVAESIARTQRSEIERCIPMADFECPHGYVYDGPCACFQFYRVEERP